MTSNTEEPKKKIKNYKYFGLETASPTFQKIIFKYKNKRKDLNEKPKSIMGFVEKARFQAENMETEDEYMIKELRSDRKFTQQLIFLYGNRAEKHYNEINNHKELKSKLKKSYFFTPSEIQRLRESKINNAIKRGSLPLLTKFIFNKKKSVFSPDTFLKSNLTTLNSEKKNFPSSKNSTEMLGFFNTTGNIKSHHNNKKRINDINRNCINKFQETNSLQAKNKKGELLLCLNTKTDSFRDRILSKTNRSNTLFKNKTNNELILNKMMYMDKLVQINKDFLKTKNEFRKHFKNNDYGCQFSKLEYEYLTKKYFNK